MPMPATERHDASPGLRSWALGATILRAAGAAGLLAFAQPAAAQSPNACVDLDEGPIPSVEGLDGMFYRIDPDLAMDVRLPDTMVRDLAQVSDALEARGTRLVYVPLPTKGLVLDRSLGAGADLYGFDVRLARALYADSVADLRRADIVTVDALAGLAGAAGDEGVFFGTDPRLTSTGSRHLAQAIAAELGENGGDAFAAVDTGVVEIDSRPRFLLQLSCQAELAPLQTKAFAAATPLPEDGSSVAVVGSALVGSPEGTFPALLTAALGRRVVREVMAEDAHAALSAYLTSDGFAADMPDTLIWIVPVGENPARFGDQPMREIVAAARDDCERTVPVTEAGDGAFLADLGSVAPGDAASLRLDTGGEPLRGAVFRFAAADGRERIRWVARPDTVAATGRLYQPLSGMGPDGARSVRIEIDEAISGMPEVAICEG